MSYTDKGKALKKRLVLWYISYKLRPLLKRKNDFQIEHDQNLVLYKEQIDKNVLENTPFSPEDKCLLRKYQHRIIDMHNKIQFLEGNIKDIRNEILSSFHMEYLNHDKK